MKPELPHKKKIEDLEKYIEKLKEEYDKVFWIVDFDTIIKQRKLNIFKRCRNKFLSEDKKIIIIINNPCLEYWFLQHFVRTTKYFESYNEELKKDLKRYITNYAKDEKFYKNCGGGKNIYSFLKPKLKDAILHSNPKNLPKFDFNKVDINSYKVGMAEMYKLFEELKISN